VSASGNALDLGEHVVDHAVCCVRFYAAIIREISKKGKDARFTKVDRGRFTANAKASK